MNSCIRSVAVLAIEVVSFSSESALAQTIERVSVDSAGVQGNNASGDNHGGDDVVSISADCRFVVFASDAANLVASDTNGYRDLFLRDRQNGTTERVSVATSGAEGNGQSKVPAISTDGRFVVFGSDASSLVVGDTNGVGDVFVRDRTNGTTERVSVATGGAQVNSQSFLPAISADGRFVAFASFASNLVAMDTNGTWDVFVRDRQSGTTERVSLSSAGAQGNSDSLSTLSISADGRFVAFASLASNLVAGDTNGCWDIFVRDRQSGTTERVNVSTGGPQGNGYYSRSPSISADGRFVAFDSEASNLVVGDSNLRTDIFVRDRQSGTTERLSVETGGTEGNGNSFRPCIAADGRFVTFSSAATNLVIGDTNGCWDIFVRDRQSGTTERTSVDSGGTQANSNSVIRPSISADGRFVALSSLASNLVSGDTNGCADVFVRDRGPLTPTVYCTAGTTSNGCNAAISASASPSVSLANTCNISVTNVERQRSGILFYGVDNTGFVPGPWGAGSTSYLCVKQPTQRTPIQNSGGTFGACNGSFVLDWNAYQSTHPLALGNPWSFGDKVYVQAWFRDPFAVKSTNLSNALEMTYVP